MADNLAVALPSPISDVTMTNSPPVPLEAEFCTYLKVDPMSVLYFCPSIAKKVKFYKPCRLCVHFQYVRSHFSFLSSVSGIH